MAYDINAIGHQIARYRKEKKWTQEEFANMIGVSPQAVSKWETGNGCPDISLLPIVASSLGIKMDQLFGHEVDEQDEYAEEQLPEEKDGLKRVAIFEGCACYSDLEVESIEEAVVHFKNGSTADLRTREILNKGGTISFEDLEGIEEEAMTEHQEVSSEGKKETNSAFGFHDIDLKGVDSLRLNLNKQCDVSITETDGETMAWKASGPMAFVKNLRIGRTDNTFVMETEKFNSGFFNFFKKRGKIELQMPMKLASRLEVKIAGSSDIVTYVNFEEADIDISGSGDLQARDLGDTRISIAGSGDVECNRVTNLDLRIAGSGDFDCREVKGDVKIKIAGSGDANIDNGRVGHMDVSVMGSGDIYAAGLDVDELDISIAGAGDVVLGRLRGASRERISRAGSLVIHQRG